MGAILEQYRLEQYRREAAVLQMAQIARSTLHKWVAEGRFPKPVKIGKRAIAWRESDLVQWQLDREAIRA